MKVAYLLDTNTFSYIVKGSSLAARAEYRRLLKDANAEVCISAITEAEVRYGMAKHQLGRARCVAIERLFATLEILPWGSEEAAVYVKVRAALEAQGVSVAEVDLLIAVHAAATGAVLVTRDTIFPRIAEVAGLPATVNWATDI